MNVDADRRSINEVVSRFFAAFSNANSKPVNLDALRDLFVDEAVIVKTCGAMPDICNIDEFIAPRAELLNGGGLTEFTEQELWDQTLVFGDMAQRLCAYRKSGELHGKLFRTDGMKSIQLIRIAGNWKIVAVVWDDEREGLAVPPYSGPQLNQDPN